MDYATVERQNWIFKYQPRPWPEWLGLWDVALYGVLTFLVTASLVVW
jgi:hypothetical protein